MRKLAALWLAMIIIGCTQAPEPELPTFPVALTTPTRALSTLEARPSATETALPATPLPTIPYISGHIDLKTLAGVGRAPAGIARLGSKIIVANSETGNVAIIENDRATRYIPVGRRPSEIAVDSSRSRIFVSNGDDKTITAIGDDSTARTIGIGDAATALLLTENQLFVGLQNKGQILVLEPDTLRQIATIEIPKSFGIINLAADPMRHRIYAAIYGKIAVVDSASRRVLSTIDAKDSYYTLAVSARNGAVLANTYDSRSSSSFLVSYEPVSGNEIARVKIGGDPRGAIVSEDGSRIYVANSFSDDVSIVDAEKMSLLPNVPVGIQPESLVLDESGKRLYVANKGSDNISIIDTIALQGLGVVPLAMSPTMILSDSKSNRLYVSNASTDSVFVVENGRVTKEIGVGHHPADLALDEQSNRLFVAHAADRKLSIIDTLDYSVRASDPITRPLSTVAVDASYARVIAQGTVLDLSSFTPIGKLALRGNTLGSIIEPELVRVNPNNGRIFALGWNGTPGSNSRTVLYSIEGDSLQQRGVLTFSGNVSALAMDQDTNRLFAAGTHPLAYTNELVVYDPNDKVIASLPLDARTEGMSFNPQTQHLFLSHSAGYSRPFGPTPIPGGDLIQVIDTRSMGVVAGLRSPAPGKMAVLGESIYVLGREDGSITLVKDMATSAPPSPTSTHTPSPWPTISSIPSPMPTIAATNTPSVSLATPCPIAPATALVSRLAGNWNARVGCPTQAVHSGNFVIQPFERGTMFWREDSKRIYVLFEDKSYAEYPDSWVGEPDDTCPNVSAPTGSKPKRGFGKLWCDEVAIRSRIGGATGPEIAFRGIIQGFNRGLIFTTDTGKPILLTSEGKWE